LIQQFNILSFHIKNPKLPVCGDKPL
jgi:hypothetical protein